MFMAFPWAHQPFASLVPGSEISAFEIRNPVKWYLVPLGLNLFHGKVLLFFILTFAKAAKLFLTF